MTKNTFVTTTFIPCADNRGGTLIGWDSEGKAWQIGFSSFPYLEANGEWFRYEQLDLPTEKEQK